ncbi:MBL fold metallo-hydrolase [Bacillus badius]|uniref:MBL fold metallo-hydrolase n=1 Tax=Bacillus badius TaxID=1455 RepID=UPI002E1BDBB6|nr:MBL fold metallo-hydrolase [Bacillus badius]
MSKKEEKQSGIVHPIIVPTSYNVGTINFYLLEVAGSLSLIDAGVNTDECWNKLNETLHKAGISISDIDRILLTHHHPDHTGVVNRLLDTSAIPVYAHKEAIPRLKKDENYLRRRINFFSQLYEEMGCGQAGKDEVEKLRAWPPSHDYLPIHSAIEPLNEGDSIAGLQVMETPGHSPDHLVFYNEKTKELFSGDVLIQNISSNAMVEPDRQNRRLLTLVQYIRSLKRCLQWDIDIMYTGHREAITDHHALIAERLSKIERKAQKIITSLRQGTKTANELAIHFYQHKYQSEFPLVISEIIGYLDYLEAGSRVYKEQKNGIWRYYSV